MQLKSSPRLQENLGEAQSQPSATFIRSDNITGRPDLDVVLEGNAELRRGDTIIRADRLQYDQPSDTAKGLGNVTINRAGNVYQGPQVQLKIDAFEGYFIEPSYKFLNNQSHGQAERVDFIDDKHSIAKNATLTSCRRNPAPGWIPDWILKANTVKFDLESDTGEAEGARLEFKGVPILGAPYLSFPLSDRRKSGALPPTVNLDNLSGLELTVPYYWNIAPNRDATLYPTLMARRGVDLGGEFRYLEGNYGGQLRASWMPQDRLRDRSRWGYSYQHSGQISTGSSALPGIGISANVNRVSDDNYWRDFPRGTSSLTQRLLPAEFNLTSGAAGWTLGARARKWQTLQDPQAPITPPYDLLPQLTAGYVRNNLGGFDIAFNADHTRFEADRSLTQQTNAKRSYALAQLSRPFVAPGYFFVPKVQWHSTRYRFDDALSTGQQSARRSVPTFSLDSGLIYERDTQLFGRAFTQTLEPRAFYVYTPFRDQNFLPNYDSAVNDFNFATIWTENAFGGNDRIADANLLTLGATSRFLDPASGAEALRLSYAQRLRFSDQKVTLPGSTPINDRFSDMLFGATINWDPRWSFDSTVQLNPKINRSIRTTLSARYSPTNYRVINAAYRLQRGNSEQIDIGWQWPLNDLWGDRGEDRGPGVGLGDGRWYAVGRLNYSLQDRKLVDTVVGLEYDAGCWITRVVYEQLQRSSNSANRRILLQLELVGFSRLGSNPLKTLRDNIPRYQFLREQTTRPSRFSSYE
jgi:LPS-assembly protein